MKLINKEFEFEHFDEFAIARVIATVVNDDKNYNITISDNSDDCEFCVDEYDNEDIDDDIIEAFKNSDFYQDLIEFANQELNRYEDNIIEDFENNLEKNYQLYCEDKHINDYKKIIYELKDKNSINSDLILKIENIYDSKCNKYYTICEDDFEFNDNFIEIFECLDSNRIDMRTYFINN